MKKTKRELLAEYMNASYKEKSHVNSTVTMTWNFFVSFGKTAIAVFLQSLFFFVSSIYSFGIGWAKLLYFRGEASCGGNQEKIHLYYRRIAVTIIAFSSVYTAYSVLLFYHPSSFAYNIYLALAIATLSFAEFSLAVYGIFRSRKNKDMLLSALKCVNLCSACINIVLTQAALLSAINPSDPANSYHNAVCGVSFGAFCALIGIVMLINLYLVNKNDQKAQEQEKETNLVISGQKESKD